MGPLKRARIAERLRRLFGGNPPHSQGAALPWRYGPGGVEVLLVTSRGTGRWVLPKGWPEKNETLSETAKREAYEEAGVRGTISEDELGRYLYRKTMDSGVLLRCEVAVFPLKVEQEARKWPERKKRIRRWVRKEEAAMMIDEADLAELICSFTVNPRKNAA